MDFSIELATEPRPQFRTDPEGPLRVLVLGDFSGRRNRGILEFGDGLASRPVLPVDVDRFEHVLLGYAPRIHLPPGGPTGVAVTVDVKRLDDFHPDELLRKLETFRSLRDTRRQLLDPRSFADTVAGLQSESGGRVETDRGAGAVEDDAATVSRLLGRDPVGTPQVRAIAGTGDRTDLDSWIRKLIASHVVPAADPRQDEWVASVDAATGAQMRSVLHDPAFQELEALWRSVSGLVSGLDLGERLELHLLDVSRDELIADCSAAAGDLSRSGLHRRLAGRDDRPWSLLVGDLYFGCDREDLELLTSLGALASATGAPLLAGAGPGLVGRRRHTELADGKTVDGADTGFEARWRALRASAVAPWLGLALPRVLLRMPYGARTDEIEGFAFEELATPPDHGAFLWGNPAFACALLIGQAFEARGWEMQPGDLLDLEDLPAYSHAVDGEPRLQPGAELCLSSSRADALLARGLMPLLSSSNRNAVRVVRFQSVADPPRPLGGPWS